MTQIPLRKPYAIYVITKHGLEIGKTLLSQLKGSDLYVSTKIQNKFPSSVPAEALPLSLPMEPTLKETFEKYDCHIHIISVGAVVRMIAPLLKNKKVDPAIVTVDDKAQFSICLLSGHVGRGNFFTQQVASVLGNLPVITTASDVSGTLTVDILGRDLGWTLEDSDRNVTRGCAAVVNETRVLFVQESGEPNWWPMDKALPKGVEYASSLDGIQAEDYEILLIASDRANLAETHPEAYQNSVIYHPKSLVLGLGCDRDTPFSVVEAGVLKALRENGLALASVKMIASLDKKKDEPAFLQLAEKYHWPFHTFAAEELDQVVGIHTPSEQVKNFVGTRSVSEASALLAAQVPPSSQTEIIVPKMKYRQEEGGKNMTIAIARIGYAKRNLESQAGRISHSEKVSIPSSLQVPPSSSSPTRRPTSPALPTRPNLEDHP